MLLMQQWDVLQLLPNCTFQCTFERGGRFEHSSLCREQTLDLVTGVSRLLVREFGTVYPPHCGSLTLNLDSLNDF